jgi:aryl-alcohol dehydrogenase-like predicted oxidoreductase
MLQTEWRPKSLQIAPEIKRYVESRGITPGEFAVAWVLNNRFVTPVIGPLARRDNETTTSGLSFIASRLSTRHFSTVSLSRAIPRHQATTIPPI